VHVLNPRDNVATALVDLEPGTVVEVPREGGGGPVPLDVRAPIPFGHKLALVAIARGQPVVKYGEVIGLATQDIAPGQHVHTHNVESQRGRGDLERAR
jgi:altronate dehydratase small subunit